MDTWLSPRVIERCGDRELTHEINLAQVPVRIGRSPGVYEADSYIRIGAIAPALIQKRISRCQATITYSSDGEYYIKDGNGTESGLGVYYDGKRIETPLKLYPGIRELLIVPQLQGARYECRFQWLQSEQLEGEGEVDPLKTMGARNVYLESQLESKNAENSQLVGDVIALQEQVEYLTAQHQKEKLAEVEQNHKIAQLYTSWQKLKKLWTVLGVLIALIAVVLLGIDPELINKLISGVIVSLTAFGVIKTQSGD